MHLCEPKEAMNLPLSLHPANNHQSPGAGVLCTGSEMSRKGFLLQSIVSATLHHKRVRCVLGIQAATTVQPARSMQLTPSVGLIRFVSCVLAIFGL